LKTRLTALLLLATLPAASDTIAPKDDFLLAVQEIELRFTAADLLKNDGPPSPGPITLTSRPTHGTLRQTAEGYTYLAFPGYVGRDQFTYAISDGLTLRRAIVQIEVAPDHVAFKGDFDGDGIKDWGWFDSAAAAFHACYGYPGPAPRCVVLWTAPAWLAGGSPIVGDWNLDRRDDAGVFDPRTGSFHLQRPGDPTAAISFPLGAGGGTERPLVGDWNGDGRKTVGLYRERDSRFLLRNQNSTGPFDHDFTFGAEFPTRSVLATAWPELRLDAVAVHAGELLYFYAPASGRREARYVGCPTHPRKLPIEYTWYKGLIRYDVDLDVAQGCGRLAIPITVYLPPD